MKNSGLMAYGLGEWEPPGMTESELLALEVGLLVGARKPHKPQGRRKLPKFQSVNCRRAYSIWFLVNRFPEKALANRSTRELIEISRSWEIQLGVPANVQLFPHLESIEQSVSRGKTELNIGKCWRSRTCEELSSI